MCPGCEWCTLYPHQSQLWDGSAQGPLLAVGNIYWRETDRDKQSARQRLGERFIILLMYSKKGSHHNGLWESNHSHSCCVTGRHKADTCGLAGRLNENNL